MAMNWQPRPGKEYLSSNFELLRCNKKVGYKITCVILSHCIVGKETHNTGGKTEPCQYEAGSTENDEVRCPYCDGDPEKNIKAQSPRWYGYIAVLRTLRVDGEMITRRCCLEITPGVFEKFESYLKQKGTLRGALLVLTRKGETPNGRLQVEVLRPFEKEMIGEKFEAFDIQKCLCRMWQVPYDGAGTTQQVAAVQSQVHEPGECPERVTMTPAGIKKTAQENVRFDNEGGVKESLFETNGEHLDE